MRHTWFKGAVAGALLVAGLSFGTVDAGAQSWIAGVGNGGTGGCGANGGAVGLGTVNSGGNAGSDIGIGDTSGEVDVYGGDWSWSTRIRANQSGGTAVCGGGGGGFNVGFPF
jgi:hypothetical protein